MTIMCLTYHKNVSCFRASISLVTRYNYIVFNFVRQYLLIIAFHILYLNLFPTYLFGIYDMQGSRL